MDVPPSQSRELSEDRNTASGVCRLTDCTGKGALFSNSGCLSETNFSCLEEFRQFRAICVWNFLYGEVSDYGVNLFDKNIRLSRFLVSFRVSSLAVSLKASVHLSGVVPSTDLK